MTDAVSQIVDRFPQNRDVILLLQRTDSRFGSLCEEYVATNSRLNALVHMKSAEALASVNALRQHRTTIEEELVTAIEGYCPV